MRPFMLNNSIRLIRPQTYQPLRPGQLGLGGIRQYPLAINNYYNGYGYGYPNSCWTDYRSGWDKAMDYVADGVNLLSYITDITGDALGWFKKSDDGAGGTA